MSFLRWVGGLFVVAAAIAAALGFWAYRYWMAPVSPDRTILVFEVGRGESLNSISRRLESEALIQHAELFAWCVRLSGNAGNISSGEMALQRSWSPRRILDVLLSKREIEYVLSLSEGLNRFEIAQIVERSGLATGEEFLNLSGAGPYAQSLFGSTQPEGVSLEGYLFPETYSVTRAQGAAGLIKTMFTRFKAEFAKINRPPGFKLSDREFVILASIIEKETGASEERPLISSVFHNRLRERMRLQTDPTVIYSRWLDLGSWNGNISRADLTRPHPYNTYMNAGLPPGPISNPGRESLAAAVAPAVSDYFYFVSRNDGTHTFSTSFQDHQKAVNEYQVRKESRQGKSWRDLRSKSGAAAAAGATIIKKGEMNRPTPRVR